MVLLLGFALAQSGLPSGVARLYEAAVVDREQGNMRDAAAGFRAVIRLQPGWNQAVVELGRTQELDGAELEALATYRTRPFDPDVLEHLALLLAKRDEHTEAARIFADLAGSVSPRRTEFSLLEAESRVEIDPVGAEEALRRVLSGDVRSVETDRLADVVVAVVHGVRLAGQTQAATEILSQAVELQPDLSARDDVDRLWAHIDVSRAARSLAAAGGVPLTPAEREQLVLGRSKFAAGDLDGASVILEALLVSAPQGASAWAAAADVREARGDILSAEAAWLAAEGLDPSLAAYPAGLARLLDQHYAGQFDGEAADAWARAVYREGASVETWFRKASAERRAGRPGLSAASYRRFLELGGGGRMAERATVFLAGVGRERASAPEIAPIFGRPSSVTPGAWDAYHRALIWQRRAVQGDTWAMEEARKAIVEALESGEFPAALNLGARLDEAAGDLDAAESKLAASLELDPAQGAAWYDRSLLAKRRGIKSSSEEWRYQAAGLGEPRALLAVAEEELDSWRLLSAAATLDALERSTTSEAPLSAAAELREELQSRQWGLGGLLAALGTAGAMVPVAWLLSRRRGESLETLLERRPAAYRDVARILSAIRHEVLKHNTTVLPMVASAIEQREFPTAVWAADRLMASRGPLERFWEYIAELQQLGELHGTRLDLSNDRVFSDLVAGMTELGALAPSLKSADARTVPDVLRQLSARLNGRAYNRLGELLHGLGVLRLSEALVSGAFERAASEFPESGASLEWLEPPEDATIKALRGDIEDMLTNFFRNAIEAGAEAGDPRVGVSIGREFDFITGLERVELRILDQAPKPLTTAMIRGRYIGRGLGLAVDLASRSGAAVSVESASGWEKAVVIRVPAAEVSEEEP